MAACPVVFRITHQNLTLIFYDVLTVQNMFFSDISIQQMYEASFNFQGSTFQVPDQPLIGSNSAPGCSNDPFRRRTALTINKDGQPEFVAELI